MPFKKRFLLFTALTMFVVGCAKPEKQAQVGSTATPATASASKTKGGSDLIARETLFGNPDRAGAQVSPDGKQLAFLAPLDGVLNVWVAPIDKPASAKAVTKDTNRGIRRYFWAYTNQHVVYLQDKGGDENWRVYSVDLSNNNAEKDLTPFDKVNAQIEEVSYKFPDEILVGLNNRDAKFHDIHRVNIRTGEMKLVTENKEYAGFVTDEDYNTRFAMRNTPDGGNEILKPDGSGAWTSFIKIAMEDAMTTSPAGFDKSGKVLYLIDSRNRNTAALTTLNLDTNAQAVVGEDPRSDISNVMTHPTENTIQAYATNFERPQWKVVDRTVQGDLDYLKTVSDGDFTVTSRTLDDNRWIVVYNMDNGPVRYYRYDRPQKKATFLFTNNQNLEKCTLAKMRPTIIKSRDGWDLVSYLTLPAGKATTGGARPSKPLPMVLYVHGGPWGRDTWGYNPTHQWLANRGYAVLSVNYRGSTGMGKKFINAANLEWAGKMHDDLIDAVNWAVKEKIADPKKVAIMGGSYGGYATLVGVTFTPEVFACGVDIVGPSNLVTLLNTIPPYWTPMIETFTKRVGDHRTEDGKSFLTQRSPLTFVDRIKKPLLIGQGANDPRVKQAEADQIVKAMQDKKIPVTYVLYPDEGHGFARPQNRMSFNAVAEAFLAEHLGGRYQPIGTDFKGSTITVPTGATQVPGLADSIGSSGKTD